MDINIGECAPALKPPGGGKLAVEDKSVYSRFIDNSKGR